MNRVNYLAAKWCDFFFDYRILCAYNVVIKRFAIKARIEI